MAELASQPTSVQSVYTWFRDDKLFVNRRYQRKLVWTLEEKQKLIDSILHRYPIPAILLAEKDGRPGSYEIIDGLQRLHAIVSFIENAFRTTGGQHFNLEHFPTAKSHADAGDFVFESGTEFNSQKDVSTILDYSLALSVMRNASEQEINDVFDRINTYGHRLSDQERRQAGVRNDFSAMVRQVSCNLRGDVSAEVLPLYQMPSISIDLPKTKHGYEIKAEEVFWVKQGVLRSTDLRDSMDEQCVADIAACIIGGTLIERSKDALDQIFDEDSPEASRINTALEIYGKNKFFDEFNFCVQEIIKICEAGKSEKLRDIVFKPRTTNAFPSVFAVILIAVYELIIKNGMQITDYAEVKKGINSLSKRIETGGKGTSVIERRKNIDTTKGLMSPHFVKIRVASQEIYGNHTSIDIEGVIRRSEIELANYELKQGILTLTDKPVIDDGIFQKVIKTICAVANNGPHVIGKILIGVTDKDQDAERCKKLFSINPMKVGKRFVVGVTREAKYLELSMEEYVSKWKDEIAKSGLSQGLKDSVLSRIDYNSFYGLGIIIITIPVQKEACYVGEEMFWRKGDSTELAKGAKQIAEIAKRF